MRDDSAKWDAPAVLADTVRANGLVLTQVDLTRQTLISGPGVLAQTEWPVVGWPGLAPAAPYAIALRRDRVLVVDGPEMTDGWHEETNCAVSDASDAYAVFDLSGARAFGVLQRGAELSLDVPSKSAARLLFGLGVFLYRIEAEDRFRIHVASGHAEALLAHIHLQMPHGS